MRSHNSIRVRQSQAAAILLLLAVCGCGRNTVASPLPTHPQRIISLAPSLTEILFSLGLGPRLVGCTSQCNYPPQVKSLARVGDLNLDYERIISLSPDLVAIESITPREQLRRLRQLGLPVLEVDSQTLRGYRQTLRVLGERTGTEARAAQCISSLDREVESLRKNLEQLQTRPSVFVEIAERPLITAAGGTFIDEMITLAGGHNLFGDLRAYPKIDPEALVSRDPQVIILTDVTEAEFGSHAAFAGLNAVRSGRLYRVNPDVLVRPGPRLEQGLELLAECLRGGPRP